MKTLSLIEYKDDNWLAVCQLHDRARPIELKGSCDERAFIPLAEDKNDHDNFHNSVKYVAYFENEVAGFVGTRNNEITWLYVEPSLCGHGIGRTLLRKALSNFTTVAYLYVLDGNKPAKMLYESEGFKIVDKFQSKDNGYNCTVLKLSQ